MKKRWPWHRPVQKKIFCSLPFLLLFGLQAPLYCSVLEKRPSLGPGSPLSFSLALERFLKRDTEEKRDAKQLEMAKSSYKAAKLDFLPKLSLGASRSKDSIRKNKLDIISGRLSLNAWNSGRDYYRYKAIKKQKEEEAEFYKEKRLVNEALAVKLLLENIHQKIKLEALKKLFSQKSQGLLAAKERYKKGLTPSIDVLKAEIDFENLRSRLQDEKNHWTKTQADLTIGLGHTNILYKWPWKSFFEGPKKEQILGLKINLKTIPKYKKLHHQKEKHHFQKKASLAQYLPSVNIDIRRQLTKSQNYRQYESVGLLELKIPLFSGGSTYEAHKNAQYRIEQTKQKIVALERQQKAQASFYKNQYQNALTQLKIRTKTRDLSAKVYETNFKRYRAGRISLDELILDQERLLMTVNLEAQGQKKAHIAFLELCHFYGKKVLECFGP